MKVSDADVRSLAMTVFATEFDVLRHMREYATIAFSRGSLTHADFVMAVESLRKAEVAYFHEAEKTLKLNRADYTFK